MVVAWQQESNLDDKEQRQDLFDIKIPTPKGAVFAMYFKQNMIKQGEYANGGTDSGLKLTIERAHACLGEDAICKFSRILNFLG